MLKPCSCGSQDRDPRHGCGTYRLLRCFRLHRDGTLVGGRRGTLCFAMRREDPGKRLVDRARHALTVVDQRVCEVDEHRRLNVCEPGRIQQRRARPVVGDDLLDGGERVGVRPTFGEPALERRQLFGDDAQRLDERDFLDRAEPSLPPASLVPDAILRSSVGNGGRGADLVVGGLVTDALGVPEVSHPRALASDRWTSFPAPPSRAARAPSAVLQRAKAARTNPGPANRAPPRRPRSAVVPS
jgi:hypothetical protein